MLEVGWSEILVIALILIIVVGPKDLPPMLRTFGRMASRLRGMANEFKGQFDQALREAELDDVRKGLSEVNKLNPTNSLRDAINPIRKLGEDIKSDLRKASDMNTPAATSSVTADAAIADEKAAEPAAEDIGLADIIPDLAGPSAKPGEAVAPPLMQAAVAPVVPPVAQKAAEPTPATQPYVPHVVETPKPKATRKKVAALEAAPEAAVASPAEPKTRKAPVKTKDAAIAAVATEAAAKKPASRKKPVVSEVALEAVADDAAKPKRTAPRKKIDKAVDDQAGEA
jgi:sec-independent protein translocase protein TatB